MLKIKSFKKACLLSGLLLLTAMPVQADDVDNRLNRLENELSTLSRAIYKGETPPAGIGLAAPAQADSVLRVQQLESELRALNGKLEEQSNEIRTLKRDLNKVSSDTALRLGDLEKGMAPAKIMPTATPKPKITSAVSPTTLATPITKPVAAPKAPVKAKATPLADGKGASKYENAFALLKQSQYEAAQREFEQFLAQYPGHSLSGNAKYWLGETYYVRGDYDRAARIFAEGYQQYPKGSKAPDNLLKLGMALGQLGQTSDACVALRQVQKEYPSGAGPVVRRAEQEISRLGCDG